MEQMAAIDSEFQSLIPPLSDDEYERLEKSILAEGVRHPIITWNNTIIDGHNRYNICEEHGIKCPQVERKFESRDAAKIWIIENQFGRRNLSSGQKATLAIEQEEAKVREAARLRKKQAGKEHGRGMSAHDNSLSSKEPKLSDDSGQTPPAQEQTGRTAEILARKAGIGAATIKRALRVKQDDPELYEQVRKGEVTVTGAYEKVIGEKRVQHADDGRRICTICGEPINDGDHYQDKLNWHRDCGLAHATETQRQYRNPTIGSTSEVLEHDKDELRESLLLVAQDMGDTLQATIARYETMGVKLKKSEATSIIKSIAALVKSIERIGS